MTIRSKTTKTNSHRISAQSSVVLSFPCAGKETAMNYQLGHLEFLSIIVQYQIGGSPSLSIVSVGHTCGEDDRGTISSGDSHAGKTFGGE